MGASNQREAVFVFVAIPPAADNFARIIDPVREGGQGASKRHRDHGELSVALLVALVIVLVVANHLPGIINCSNSLWSRAVGIIHRLVSLGDNLLSRHPCEKTPGARTANDLHL